MFEDAIGPFQCLGGEKAAIEILRHSENAKAARSMARKSQGPRRELGSARATRRQLLSPPRLGGAPRLRAAPPESSVPPVATAIPSHHWSKREPGDRRWISCCLKAHHAKHWPWRNLSPAAFALSNPRTDLTIYFEDLHVSLTESPRI